MEFLGLVLVMTFIGYIFMVLPIYAGLIMGDVYWLTVGLLTPPLLGILGALWIYFGV